MKHYVQYHKIHELGGPTSQHGEFLAFTDKNVSDCYIGQTIWLVSGEKQGAKTAYLLEFAFVVNAIDKREEGRTILQGIYGHMPTRPTPVRLAPWFIEMQRRTRNFSNGLSALPDELIGDIADALGWKEPRIASLKE